MLTRIDSMVLIFSCQYGTSFINYPVQNRGERGWLPTCGVEVYFKNPPGTNILRRRAQGTEYKNRCSKRRRNCTSNRMLDNMV
jgi:hypothetical protein